MAHEVTLVVKAPLPDVNPQHWVRATFHSILQHLITDDVAPHDGISFTFFSAERMGQRLIGLSVRRRDQFDVEFYYNFFKTASRVTKNF